MPLSDQLLTFASFFCFLMPVLFQDHVKSNHSVRRDSTRKETGGAGRKDTGKTAKKTGMPSFQILPLHCAYLMFWYDVDFLCACYTSNFVDKGKTAKEEARELLLREEYSIREKVKAIQKNLSMILRALGAMAIANPIFAHSQLSSMVPI